VPCVVSDFVRWTIFLAALTFGSNLNMALVLWAEGTLPTASVFLQLNIALKCILSAIIDLTESVNQCQLK